MEELSPACVHVRFYFFTAAHFHFAASISHFLTAALKFPRFSSNEIRLPSSFSVIHVRVNVNNKVEKDTTCCCFFLSKSQRAVMRFFRCIWVAIPLELIELFYSGVPLVRTDGQLLGRCTVT